MNKRALIVKNFLSVIIFLIFIVMAAGSVPSTPSEPKDPNAWKSEDNSTMAYIMMEDFVKKRLRSPSSAKFPGVFDGKLDHVKYSGNHRYIISSYVDAQNGFGAMIRNTFYGEIEQTGEHYWRLISLSIN